MTVPTTTRRTLAAVALALAAGTPAPAQAGVREDDIGVTFPDRLGGLVLESRKTFADKALGDAVSYTAEGIIGSIYVYDDGLAAIPDDLDSAVLRHEFDDVMRAVAASSRDDPRWVAHLPAAGMQKTAWAGCGPQFLWEPYGLDAGARRLNSAAYLTAVRGRFVKLRLSYERGDTAAMAKSADFLAQVRAVLGGCR
jgi:hypothetical protein